MVSEQEAFVANSSAVAGIPFPFRVATNTHDVHPDTGAARFYSEKDKQRFTADDALISSLTTMKFQLLPRLTIGNCCSNFHNMIRRLHSMGCSASRDHHFHCMQDNEDPALRMCCKKGMGQKGEWRGDRCMKERAEALQAAALAEGNTTASSRV